MEVTEEYPRHVFVIMLPGVNQELFEGLGVLAHRRQNRRGFHEVGAGRDHVHDSHRRPLTSRQISDSRWATRSQLYSARTRSMKRWPSRRRSSSSFASR